MRPIDFLTWMRDEVKCCPLTKRGSGLGYPSNQELKQWLKDGAVRVNQVLVGTGDVIEFPITDLVFFPKNDKKRATII